MTALFFGKRAELWDEFDHLYYTLFSNGAQYVKIVEVLSKKRSGLTRGEIIKETGLANNGVLTKMLENLENSGFVRVNNEFGRKKREKTYQLSDYYTSFYFRFVRENGGRDEHFWSDMTDNPAKSVWAGLAFEQVCKDHLAQIKKKLGISGVMTEVSSWKKIGDESGPGAQIDLVIKRRDKVIDLCEIKFVSDEFEITKEYEERLRSKVSVFRETTGTRDTLQTMMITTYGVKKNSYGNIVSKEVLMNDLFEEA